MCALVGIVRLCMLFMRCCKFLPFSLFVIEVRSFLLSVTLSINLRSLFPYIIFSSIQKLVLPVSRSFPIAVEFPLYFYICKLHFVLSLNRHTLYLAVILLEPSQLLPVLFVVLSAC